MVKVKLLIARTGGQNAGDVVDVTPAEAERMVEAGQAEIVRATKKAEKAVKR